MEVVSPIPKVQATNSTFIDESASFVDSRISTFSGDSAIPESAMIYDQPPVYSPSKSSNPITSFFAKRTEKQKKQEIDYNWNQEEPLIPNK